MFDDSDVPWATPVSDEELAALLASGVPVYVYGDGSGSNNGSNSGSNGGSSSSGSNGSSSSSGSNSGSTTAHEHSWKAHTVLVDDYETQTEKVPYGICLDCGFKDYEYGAPNLAEHMKASAMSDNWTCARTSVMYDYVTTQVKVGSHEEVDYYYCDCGAPK